MELFANGGCISKPPSTPKSVVHEDLYSLNMFKSTQQLSQIFGTHIPQNKQRAVKCSGLHMRTDRDGGAVSKL